MGEKKEKGLSPLFCFTVTFLALFIGMGIVYFFPLMALQSQLYQRGQEFDALIHFIRIETGKEIDCRVVYYLNGIPQAFGCGWAEQQPQNLQSLSPEPECVEWGEDFKVLESDLCDVKDCWEELGKNWYNRGYKESIYDPCHVYTFCETENPECRCWSNEPCAVGIE